LMAIGMSVKGLRKLLAIEGGCMSLISALLSVALGLTLGFGLFMLLVHVGADYLDYNFPLLPLIFLCLFQAAIPYCIVQIAIRRLRLTTVVELVGK